MQINSVGSSSLLGQIQEKQESLFEKLASGKKVNNAIDGATAQQIIERLTSEGEGKRQAITNVFDGISFTQTAESGLSNINFDVERIRELTVQSGNGILSAADRDAIQSEITQLQKNISQTIEQTNFAGRPLLSEDDSISFQAGVGANQSISVDTQNVASEIDGILNINITSGTSVNDALSAADQALEFIGSARSELGATQNRFESVARVLTQGDIDAAESRGRIQDLDFAQATSQSVINNIRSQAALTVQAQANIQEGQALALLS